MNESRRKESLYCLFCDLSGAETCLSQAPSSHNGLRHVTGAWRRSAGKGVRKLGNCTLWVGNPAMGGGYRQAGAKNLGAPTGRSRAARRVLE